MDIELTKEAIVKNVYHIKRDKKIPLHKHVGCKRTKLDELTILIKGWKIRNIKLNTHLAKQKGL